ncbi:MAG: carbohydrate kinase family protein [Candidatus Paceibacterota bacterium]
MKKIISVGSATYDIYLRKTDPLIFTNKKFINKKGIAFPLGAKVKVKEMNIFSGGGATNTAFTFQRMGIQTKIICRLGKDYFGERILEELQKEGIDTSLVQYDYINPTAFSVILLLEDGERTILSYKGANERFTFEEVPLKELETNWIFLGSLGKNLKNLKFFLRLKKEKSIKLAINPSREALIFFKKHKDLLSFFDVFIVNQEEASYLTGINYFKEKELFKTLDQWVKGIAVMTKGKNGVSVSDGQILYSAEALNFKNFIKSERPSLKILKKRDTTGAGDAFASAFVGSLVLAENINEEEIEKAIKLALINSSSVVNYLGAKTGILFLEDIDFNSLSKIKINKIKLKV